MDNRSTRPLIYVIIIVLVAVVAVLAVIAISSLHSPQQDALSQYVRNQYTIQSGLVVSQVVQASHPERFTADMSGNIFGASSFGQAGTTVSASTPGASGPAGQSPGQPALPYPPKQLACVLLGSRKGASVVFVALHQDALHAQWVVHQARYPWPSVELKAQLNAVGCQFSNTGD